MISDRFRIKVLILLIIFILVIFIVINDKNKHYQLEKKNSYNFSFINVIIIESDELVNLSSFFFRNKILESTFSKQSKGMINLNQKIILFNITKNIDLKNKKKTFTTLQWIDLLEKHFQDYEYDILLFSPQNRNNQDWCNDSPSMGYNKNKKIYFCLETESNDQMIFKKDITLMIHKIFHGFGYNHIVQENSPMKFIESHIGFPSPKQPNLYENHDNIYFNKQLMKVLNILPRNKYEYDCLDFKGFNCKSYDCYFCENSINLNCLDSDKDGKKDSEDDYLYTPPKSINKIDSDSDGIPDNLDLCKNNFIPINSNGEIKKNKIIFENKLNDNNILIEFANLNITHVNIKKSRYIYGYIRFPLIDYIFYNNTINKDYDELFPNSKYQKLFPTIIKLEIFYQKEGISYYKPFYLYNNKFILDHLEEKEWYYFSRYGCDVPNNIDFNDFKTYDKNLDGIPDDAIFKFAKKIDQNYDWDSDLVADIFDKLPTINGNCSNSISNGLIDTDQDGFCDPYIFLISNQTSYDPQDLIFKLRTPNLFDKCPYIYGDSQNGCPLI